MICCSLSSQKYLFGGRDSMIRSFVAVVEALEEHPSIQEKKICESVHFPQTDEGFLLCTFSMLVFLLASTYVRLLKTSSKSKVASSPSELLRVLKWERP
mmetsp:Transcript_33594/g.52874  ORF Transcript_33594/g.52874 Transcript_33594/m.52874 type:complete len:99 (-) Transcript_33594:14-310(-)